MKFTAFALIVALALLTASLAAEAQQPTKVPRIGMLSTFSPELPQSRAVIDAFRQGLRELGWVMDRRAFVAGTLNLLAAPLAAETQPAGKVHRVGYLGAASPAPQILRFVEAFRRGLREPVAKLLERELK